MRQEAQQSALPAGDRRWTRCRTPSTSSTGSTTEPVSPPGQPAEPCKASSALRAVPRCRATEAGQPVRRLQPAVTRGDRDRPPDTAILLRQPAPWWKPARWSVNVARIRRVLGARASVAAHGASRCMLALGEAGLSASPHLFSGVAVGAVREGSAARSSRDNGAGLQTGAGGRRSRAGSASNGAVRRVGISDQRAAPAAAFVARCAPGFTLGRPTGGCAATDAGAGPPAEPAQEPVRRPPDGLVALRGRCCTTRPDRRSSQPPA